MIHVKIFKIYLKYWGDNSNPDPTPNFGEFIPPPPPNIPAGREEISVAYIIIHQHSNTNLTSILLSYYQAGATNKPLKMHITVTIMVSTS